MLSKLKLAYKMEITKQTQSAGDNSTQMQAGVINNNYTIVNGIDEARARDIWKEEYALACKEWTSEAERIAHERVAQLENKVMPKMLSYDASLRFLSDPSFLFLLRKAQITAASSEREADYDMLSDLLLHRLEQSENRERRLGITKAIEIVDQLSDESVIGLSMIYAITKFEPTSEDLHDGLLVLNKLYEKIIEGKDLPKGKDWLEHLDILSAIRLVPQGVNSFKKAEQYLPAMFAKHLVSGVKEDSEEYEKIKIDFQQCDLPPCFVPHPLKPGYMKLKISNDIDDIYVVHQDQGGRSVRIPLNEEQRIVMNKAIDIARKDEHKNNELGLRLIEKWNELPTLNIVREWWNSIPSYFSITPIGSAIANAYIRGKDPTIPSLY